MFVIPWITVVKRMSVPSGTYNLTWLASPTIKFYKRLNYSTIKDNVKFIKMHICFIY